MGDGEKGGAHSPDLPISPSPHSLIQWAARWHVAFLALLALLALHALSTMGVYVVSDDLAWVQRAAADAHRPWNAFVQPLFGDYYRPIPELVWTLNYRLWGFDFDGHQFMFILMWLAGVCAVYAVGCRLGGRIAGFSAAMLIGLNNVYLVLSSWKSWYTTLTEYVAVLACVWAALKWVEERRPRYAVAAAALAAIAVLSRELAPLVLSAVALFILVLPGFKRVGPGRGWRAVSWLIVWAVVTGGVLFALPSYRSSLSKLLKSGPAPASAAAGARTSPAAYVWTRFVGHNRGIFGLSTLAHTFGWGLSWHLLWFAMLLAALRARRKRPAFARRYHYVLLGAFLLGAIVLAAPGAVSVMGEKAQAFPRKVAPWATGAMDEKAQAFSREMGGKAQAFAAEILEPAAAAVLILLFCAAAFAGDWLDRMLGAWFVVSFAPVLFLEHTSNAYHLLALTALALFTARALPGFVHDELLPTVARLRGRAPPGAARSVPGDGTEDDYPRWILVAIFGVLVFAQVTMLSTNVRLADSEIQKRVAYGRAVEARVDGAIQNVLDAAGPARRVWIGPKPYAELAGLILQEKYRFKVQRTDQKNLISPEFADPLVPIRADARR